MPGGSILLVMQNYVLVGEVFRLVKVIGSYLFRMRREGQGKGQKVGKSK